MSGNSLFIGRVGLACAWLVIANPIGSRDSAAVAQTANRTESNAADARRDAPDSAKDEGHPRLDDMNGADNGALRAVNEAVDGWIRGLEQEQAPEREPIKSITDGDRPTAPLAMAPSSTGPGAGVERNAPSGTSARQREVESAWDDPEHADDFADFGGLGFSGGAPTAPADNKSPMDEQQNSPDSPETENTQTSNNNPARGVSRVLDEAKSKLLRVTVDGLVRVEVDTPIDRAELADPEVADIRVTSPNQFVVVGKTVGATRLLLHMQDEIRSFHILVEPNLVVLEDLIKSISPMSKVEIHSINGTIALSGQVSDAQSATRIMELAKAYQGGDIVNHLNVAGDQQTLLRVVVAEVNRKSMRSLGINWAIGGSRLSRDFFLANNLGQLNPTAFTSSGLPDLRQGQITYSVAPNTNGILSNLTFGFPRAELQFFMNALRENGLARVLAEPNLVAISGQTATFLAGGEVPIPVTQGGATAGAIVIEYKEFGIRLAFTPTALGQQKMRIHVMTEISDAIPDSRQIANLPVFTFTTRRVESTVECGSGQTFAIAGLLDERVNALASKIPGLGDLPVLGTLFSSVDYQSEKTELVVLVTPILVEPLEPDQVPAPPGSLMTHPNDLELFGLQMLEGAPRNREASDAPEEGDETIQYDEVSKQSVTSVESGVPGLQVAGPRGFETNDPSLTHAAALE